MSITKRFRLIVDYEVEVEDWSESVLANERKEYSDADTPEFARWESRQKRLFEALIRNPDRVEQLCRRAMLDIAEMDLERLTHQFDVPDESALVVDAFKDLSQSDAAYWLKESSGEWFYERSQFVRNRIKPYITDCKLQNLETGDFVTPNQCESAEQESV